MGLQVYAYTNIKHEPDKDDAALEYSRSKLVHLGFNLYGFEKRFEGPTGIYSYESCEDILAWSYGGYSAWRNLLAEAAGYAPCRNAADDPGSRHDYARGAWRAESGPFWELIKFADNEGHIGAQVAAKLYDDFAQHNETLIAFGNTIPKFKGLDFLDGCAAFTRAFFLASNNGCVQFS